MFIVVVSKLLKKGLIRSFWEVTLLVQQKEESNGFLSRLAKKEEVSNQQKEKPGKEGNF